MNTKINQLTPLESAVKQLIKQLNTSFPLLFICDYSYQCFSPCRGHGKPHIKNSSCGGDICTRFLIKKTNSYNNTVRCIEVD